MLIKTRPIYSCITYLSFILCSLDSDTLFVSSGHTPIRLVPGNINCINSSKTIHSTFQYKPITVSLTNNPYHKIVSNKNTLFINNSKDNYCANKE